MSMDVQEARSQIVRLGKELADQRRVVEQATRAVAGLRRIIGGYVEIFPELGSLVDDIPEEDGDAPRGAEAVRLILYQYPNRWFLVSDLVEELREKGWMPDSDNPANAIRAALERLILAPDTDVVKGKRSDGRIAYSYQPDRAREEEEEPF